MAKSWIVLGEFDSTSYCTFCRRNTIDELKFGKIYQYADVQLFATHLLQHGRDEDGLLGFLLPDIRQELEKNEKIICCYCKKPGAPCCCGSKKCGKNFHFPCGLENNTFHTFRGTFRSFCPEHSVKPAIPTHFFNRDDLLCVICQENIYDLTNADVIYTSCCNNLCFHKPCIQKMALNSGYFFKCPNCSDKKRFRNSMLSQGLYIPNEDAAWELVPNYFAELYEQYNFCDATNCVCPSGRSRSDSAGSWSVIRCNMCGSHGIHRKCGKNDIFNRNEWTCIICSGVGTSATATECSLNTSRSRRSIRRTSVYGVKNRKYLFSREDDVITKMTLKAGREEVETLDQEKRVYCTIDGTRVSIFPSCQRQLRKLRVVL